MNVDSILEWERLGFVSGQRLAATASALRREPDLADPNPDCPKLLDWLARQLPGSPEERAELGRWYANADRMLRGLQRKSTYCSPVQIGLPRLDISVRVYLDPAEAGDGARSILVGMVPGDERCPEPHWFVAPQPTAPDAELAALAAGGVWRTDGAPVAILPASALVTDDDPQEQPGQVIRFLQSAINAAWASLAAEK